MPGSRISSVAVEDVAVRRNSDAVDDAVCANVLDQSQERRVVFADRIVQLVVLERGLDRKSIHLTQARLNRVDTFIDSWQDFTGQLHLLAKPRDGPMRATGHFRHLPVRVRPPVRPNNGLDARRLLGSLGARYTLLSSLGCPLLTATPG